MYINNEVQLAYEKHLIDIKAKLEHINFAVTADSQSGNVKYWGHVDSMAHISEILDEIIMFIGR